LNEISFLLVIDKPKKLAKRNIDATSVEQHLQMNFFSDEYGMDEIHDFLS
jgi:hypothetical protein